MASSAKYLHPYTVNADFIDGKLRFTLIGMISLAQTAVSFHYGDNKLSIPHVAAKGKTWVVSKQHFEISEYPLWRDQFMSQSWLEPPKCPFCYYDFAYSYLKNGGKKADLNQPMLPVVPQESELTAPFAKAHSLWLLVDMQTVRPARPEGAEFEQFAYCEEQTFPAKFPKLELPEQWQVQETFTPRRLEIDLNGHVNNVEYVKYILNWLPQDVQRGRLVKTLDTNYIASAHFDDTLVCRSATLAADGAERTVLHSIVKSDGTEVFRARTVWAAEDTLSRELAV